ncbi:MAG: HyaD/HybD family hydrogenase maturation endopeptidase [Caldimicrobium sp.]|nr:HyaD/HybD family hydrogenase maturation endopeptidase [Caldimicrobium sp.]MCX7873658.1 HyaD/HybD family hydrogenase maturation endopeptidase [Caldimicrobium sp.]MDW8094349.1 HyaD/HybD family hydrogenase maturation endopeptidase [Caldimicrobium sp.]
MKTLVVGLGNLLLKDEGFGVRVIYYLRERYMFSEEVMFLDGGTGAFFLLPYLEEADRVIFVDVVKAGGSPGEIYEGTLEEIEAFLVERISLHEIGLFDLLAILKFKGKNFREIHLIGIEPKEIAIGEELSKCLLERLPEVAKRVLQKLSEWGISYEEKVSTA